MLDDEEDLEADDNEDDYDETSLRFQMFANRVRWAPASKDGSRWDQRDSKAAVKVQRMLSTCGQVALSTDAPLPPIFATKRLGEGRFGDVVLGETEDGKQSYAVKIALRPSSELAREASILHAMRDEPYFPELFYHQSVQLSETHDEMLVMELLGSSLQRVWETTTTSTRLDARSVLRVGHGIIRALQSLHMRGWVHNDIKPGNILLGAEGTSRERELYLVDFGMATRRHDELDGLASDRAVPSAAARVGSHLYASLTAHEGRPTRPVDDMESLVYVLCFLATGRLPWQGERREHVAQLKRRMRTDGCSSMGEGSEASRELQALWSAVSAWSDDPSDSEAAVHERYAACLAICGQDINIVESETEDTRDGLDLFQHLASK